MSSHSRKVFRSRSMQCRKAPNFQKRTGAEDFGKVPHENVLLSISIITAFLGIFTTIIDDYGILLPPLRLSPEYDKSLKKGSGETDMNRFGSHPNHENRSLYEVPPPQGLAGAQRAGSFFIGL